MQDSLPRKRLKILYAAMRYDYGDPKRGDSYEHAQFFKTLERMGVDILYFDYMQLCREHGRSRMNGRLRELVDEWKPDILFSVLYKNELDKEIIKDISENTNTLTVNWFCDDQWRFRGFSSKWAKCFSWIVTTDRKALPKYRRLGCEHVMQFEWAVNPFDYRKIDTPLRHDVTFIGQPHGNRRQAIDAIRKAGINVETWGNGWENGRLMQEEMIEVFNASRINLNFSGVSTSKSFFRSEEQVKGRVFEVPACGAFLLTEPAAGLSHCYVPGKEIVVAKSATEMIECIRYYLAHEDERAAIATAGYERTMREHTYVHRFCTLFTAMGFAMSDAESIISGGESSAVTVASMPKQTPLVSVVMPVFNGDDHLRESIESILRQTFIDFELILVDDGSSKPLTQIIIKETVARDPRIRVIRQENQGKGGARNTGSRAAIGTYVAVMDQDDIASEDRLAVQLQYLEDHPEIGAVGSWGDVINAKGDSCGLLRHPLSPGAIRFAMHMKNPVLNSTGFIRRACGEKIGWYKDLAAEDYDFWSRASRAFPVANIPRLLLKYRKWDGAYTASSMDKQEASCVPIMKEAAEALLPLVSETDVKALRRAVSDPLLLTFTESNAAASLLQRLQAAYLRATPLNSEERRFVHHFTAQWLCVFAGRLRASGHLVAAMHILCHACFIAPLWTVRSVLGHPPELLKTETQGKTFLDTLHGLIYQ